MKKLEYIIKHALKSLKEQAQPVAKETDNAKSDAKDSPFTPAEEKFLGKFDAYGTTHIGIIYSLSDIGIREFITRSGADLNISPDILISLLRKKTIKLVPYTGWGRNNDYTIELQLSLDDVKGLGAQDKAKAETGSTASGAASSPSAPAEPPAPGPEVSWVIPYGELIKESTTIAKQLIAEKSKKKKSDATIYVDKSRILKRLPKGYITQLERIIDMMGKRAHTAHEKQRLVADILDNLAVNLNLTDKQIRKSFEFYKNQNKLKSVIDDLNENTNLMLESYVLEQLDDKSKAIRMAYLTKKGFAPYINNAFNFWNEIPGAIDNGMIMTNYSEDVFFDVINKNLIESPAGDKRKQAIAIDAIAYIIQQASLENGNIDVLYFCRDWFSEWEFLEMPLMAAGQSITTFDQLLNCNLIYAYVIKSSIDFDSTKQTKALKDSLNKHHIGYLETSDLQASSGKNPFTPTYNTSDIQKLVAELLTPYKPKAAPGNKKLNVSFADTLTKEQKIARGKYALVQIAKRINSFAPKAKTKFAFTETSKFKKTWVDSKGFGILIIPMWNGKYTMYADGTFKDYNDKNKHEKSGTWTADYGIPQDKDVTSWFIKMSDGFEFYI